jgi:hypothetical protein
MGSIADAGSAGRAGAVMLICVLLHHCAPGITLARGLVEAVSDQA